MCKPSKNTSTYGVSILLLVMIDAVILKVTYMHLSLWQTLAVISPLGICAIIVVGRRLLLSKPGVVSQNIHSLN